MSVFKIVKLYKYGKKDKAYTKSPICGRPLSQRYKGDNSKEKRIQS